MENQLKEKYEKEIGDCFDEILSFIIKVNRSKLICSSEAGSMMQNIENIKETLEQSLYYTSDNED